MLREAMMSDYQLSGEVKHEIGEALRNTKPSKANKISVEASDGTVVLGGVVKTNDERDKAEEAARATQGVRVVFNDIQVAV
jgi:osmotically-inducible protein OsmY